MSFLQMKDDSTPVRCCYYREKFQQFRLTHNSQEFAKKIETLPVCCCSVSDPSPLLPLLKELKVKTNLSLRDSLRPSPTLKITELLMSYPQRL